MNSLSDFDAWNAGHLNGEEVAYEHCQTQFLRHALMAAESGDHQKAKGLLYGLDLLKKIELGVHR